MSGELPARRMADYDRVIWQPRGWAYTNPIDEINAHEVALRLKLTTRRRILAEQGVDLEEVLEGLAEEEAMIDQLGLQDEPAPTTEPAARATITTTTGSMITPVRRIA